MGVAPDHLAADAVCHIQRIELPMLTRDGRVHDDLQQHIPQLIRQGKFIPGIDGLQHFVALLDEAGAQALVRLLPIPWAAARRAQTGDDGQQIRKIVAGFLLKNRLIQHQGRAVIKMREGGEIPERQIHPPPHMHQMAGGIGGVEPGERREELCRQIGVIQLGQHQAAIPRKAALLKFRRRAAERRPRTARTGTERQRGLSKAHARHNFLGQPFGRQRRGQLMLGKLPHQAERRIRHFAQMRQRQSYQLLEILGLLIEGIQRLKANALFAEPIRQRDAARLQDELPCGPHLLPCPKREALRRPNSNSDEFHVISPIPSPASRPAARRLKTGIPCQSFLFCSVRGGPDAAWRSSPAIHTPKRRLRCIRRANCPAKTRSRPARICRLPDLPPFWACPKRRTLFGHSCGASLLPPEPIQISPGRPAGFCGFRSIQSPVFWFATLAAFIRQIAFLYYTTPGGAATRAQKRGPAPGAALSYRQRPNNPPAPLPRPREYRSWVFPAPRF